MATKSNDLGFRTWREKHERVYSDCGNPIRIVYSGKLDVDGKLVIEEVGKENLYDYIQSFAESVDINNIIRRFENGETNLLERVQGFYFDTTELPKNMSELLNKIHAAETGFERMPADFKEKYGNDFQQFLCTFSPDDLISTIEFDSGNVDEKEVKTDE